MAHRKASDLDYTSLFCGAGGDTIGAMQAGLRPALAINHWREAVRVHSENFRDCGHDCRDVSETHPSRYRSTRLLWASPECPTWSPARGKRRDVGIHGQLGFTEEDEPLPTEAEERSRVTMWDPIRYAEYHGYDACVIENVVQVQTWVLLPSWYQAWEALGYAHRTLFVNSMIAEKAGEGAPQSRDRWYCVLWKKGNRAPDLELTPPCWCPKCQQLVEGRQGFKKAMRWTDRYGTQYLYLCPRCTGTALPLVLPALAAIDLSMRGERIGDRKTPLKPATRARIEAGIQRYWINPVVFDVLRDPKYRDAESEPLPTQTARQSLALYLPLVAHLRGGDDSHISASSRPVTDPIRTVTADGNHHGLVQPPLYVKMNGGVDAAGPMAHPADRDPLGALTAKGHVGLLTPSGGMWRDGTSPVDAPMPVRTAPDTDAMVPPLAVQAAGNTYDGASGAANRYLRCRPAGEHPLWAQPGTSQTGVVTVPLVHMGRTQNRSRPAGESLLTFGSGGNMGLIASYYSRESAVRPVEQPMATVTGDPRHAFVSAYNGHAVNRGVDEPMPTCTANDRISLVEGPAIEVDDCYFRMLMPREIGLGMAFPADYRVEAKQQKWVVRMYGLAVTPPVSRWIWGRVVDSLR